MACTTPDAPPESIVRFFSSRINRGNVAPTLVSNWRHSLVGMATWKIEYHLVRQLRAKDLGPGRLQDSQTFWAADLLQMMHNATGADAFATQLMIDDLTYGSYEEKKRCTQAFETFYGIGCPVNYSGWIATLHDPQYIKLTEHSLLRAIAMINAAYEWNWNARLCRMFEEKPLFIGRQDTIWEWADAYVWKSDDEGDTLNDQQVRRLFQRFDDVSEVNKFVKEIEAQLKPLRQFTLDADRPFVKNELVHINVYEKLLCRQDSLHEHMLTGFFDPSTWHWRPNLYAQAMVVVDVLLADTMPNKDDEKKLVKVFLYKTFREPREHEDDEDDDEAEGRDEEPSLETDTQHCYPPLLCWQILLRALLFRLLTEEKYVPSVEPDSIMRKYRRTVAAIEPHLPT